MTGRIEIDPEALERASRDLTDAGRRLTDSASTVDSVTISGSAFGTMNAYLGAPIALASRRTGELLRLVGEVTAALGIAAQEAADDWTAHEQNVASTFSAADVDLDAAQEIL